MGKLMKYDFRSALRLFIPLWIGVLVLSFINGFTIDFSYQIMANGLEKFFGSLIMVAYIVAVTAILLIPTIYVIVRFYQGTMKDEAYLTFTLPVSVDSVLWSKALTGMMLILTSVFVGGLSLILMLWRQFNFEDFSWGLNELFQRVNVGDLVMIGICFVVLVLVSNLVGLFQIYLAMGVGQMSNKRKIGVSVLAYVGINILVSTVSGNLLAPAFFDIVDTWDSLAFLQNMRESQIVWIVLLGLILMQLVLTAVYYFPTRYIFKNRLNLE